MTDAWIVMTDALIAVGIFAIFFEILFLILLFIFDRQYKKDIKRIDDEFRKKYEE